MAYASQSALRLWWSPACSGPFATVALNGTGKVMVRASIIEATKALNAVLVAYGYKTRYAETGAYNCRRVTGGSTYSLHAYGIALDINWSTNPYSYRLITDMLRYGDGKMPYRIEAIRTNSGAQVWRWGGKFSSNKDAMHYEITCSPSALRSGINWSTVYRGAYVAYTAPKPTTHIEDDDVKLIVKGTKSTQWYITDGITKRYISTSGQARVLVFVGLAKWNDGGPIVIDQAIVDAIKSV